MFVLRSLVVALGLLVCVSAANAADSQVAQPQELAQVVTAEKNATKLVNINSADAETLQKVKGVGKKKAQAIVKYRSKKGLFNSVEDLLKIKCRGVNQKWLDKVSKLLTV